MIRKTRLAISLLLLAGTVGLWGWSYWDARALTYHRATVVYACTFNCPGFMCFNCILLPPATIGHPQGQGFHMSPSLTSRQDGYKKLPGIGRFRLRIRPATRDFPLVVPHWFWVAVLLTLTSWLAYGRNSKRYRRRHNLCLACGYDLTGNVSGRCSECGMAIEEPT
jgi:hypothetical protein